MRLLWIIVLAILWSLASEQVEAVEKTGTMCPWNWQAGGEVYSDPPHSVLGGTIG